MEKIVKITKSLFIFASFISVLFSSVVYAESSDLDCTSLEGSNVNAQNYSRWASTVDSYLTTRGDGYMTVQAGVSSEWVVVSYYDSDFQIVDRKKLSEELPIFGAFYETSTNYFIISGQNNSSESDSVEVYRITKYDKNWNKIKSCGLFGANTYIPFDAGSCRIDIDGSYMVIRTCHEMYDTSNEGKHHQANVTILVDMENMRITDSFTRVMNNNYGYVSHSFNQFIKIDSGKIVSIDHGDAHPRSIVLMNYPTLISNGKFTSGNVTSTDIIKFPGETGNNTTGASVGGFEVSNSTYLVAGNSVELDDSFSRKVTRNVFVSCIDKSTKKVTTNYLTNYSEGETTTNTPHLLKINDNKYLVLWSRGNSVSYTFINSKGEMTTEIFTHDGQLSDCVPILDSGKVIWYTWNNSIENYYFIALDDPEKMSKKEVVFDHDYEVQNVSNGVAELKCLKCGNTKQVAVPTSINEYWNTDESNTYYYIAPEKCNIEDKLSVYIKKSYSSSLEKLSDLVVELEDKEAGSISKQYYSSDTFYIKWNKAGNQKIIIYPKYNPSLRHEYSINVVKSIEGLELSSDKTFPVRYDSDVTISAVPDGGRGTLKYKYVLVDSDNNERLLQDYSTNSSFKWCVDIVSNNLKIRVDVKDEGDGDKVFSNSYGPFTTTKAKVAQSNEASIVENNVLVYGQKVKEVQFNDCSFVNIETKKNISGKLVWSDEEVIPNAGTYTAKWNFIPNDINYESTEGFEKILINKADPVITKLPVLDDIEYNPTKSLSEISIPNGTENVNGYWQWKNNEEIPEVKKSEYSAIFVPEDGDNYNSCELNIYIKVNKATPVLDSVSASAIVYGQSLNESNLSGDAYYQNQENVAISGTIGWKDGSIKPVVADSDNTEYDIIFYPNDQDNYKSVESRTSIIIEKAECPSVVPDEQLEVNYLQDKISNDILEKYKDWIFDSDNIGDNLEVEIVQNYTVYYVGSDKDNYKQTSKSITIRRKSCTHESTLLKDKTLPTCTEDGYSGDIYCSVCDALLKKGTPIERTNHNYSKWSYYDIENHVRYCENDSTHCEYESHLWDEGIITQKSTVFKEGIKTYTCIICGGTKQEILEKLNEDVNDIKNSQESNNNSDNSQDVDYSNNEINEDDITESKEKVIYNIPELKSVNNQIVKLSDNAEPKNSSFSLLRANVSKVGSNYIKIKWTKCNNATHYIIYGNQCGKKYKYKKIATVSGNKKIYKVKKLANKKKLKKGTYYKFLVVAVTKDSKGTEKAVAVSKSLHVITKGNNKYSNYSKIKITSKKKIAIKRGKTSYIKAKQILFGKYKVRQHRKLSYESVDPRIATVSKKGKIKAKSSGETQIYIYSQNGKFAVVNVKVK